MWVGARVRVRSCSPTSASIDSTATSSASTPRSDKNSRRCCSGDRLGFSELPRVGAEVQTRDRVAACITRGDALWHKFDGIRVRGCPVARIRWD